MKNNRTTDKLASLVLALLVTAILFFVCKSLKSVLLYILAAAVLALIGRPLSRLLMRVRIGKWRFPMWLISILTLILIMGVFCGIIMMEIPVFSKIASDFSQANIGSTSLSVSGPLSAINDFLRTTFDSLEPDFRIEDYLLEKMESIFDLSMFPSLISSVASFLASVGVGLFSMVFIAFFFIKDPELFPNMLAALVPDHLEAKTRESMAEISHLVTRYFSGLFIEVLGVMLLDFLGLLLIGRMGFQYSIGIAFFAGILNVIPYVGPLIGEVVGATLSVTAQYLCAGSIGLNVSPLLFFIIVFAVLLCTQLVDNFFFQPLIYSSSIKAHPLEIFIVLLLAGHFGGILGMFVAIPSYTVLRVVAAKFFGDVKPVRLLTGGNKNTGTDTNADTDTDTEVCG